MNGRRTLLLVAPESFYFSNPAGVPQLTGVIGQIILARKGVFFSELLEGSGLSFRINYGLKERCEYGME